MTRFVFTLISHVYNVSKFGTNKCKQNKKDHDYIYMQMQTNISNRTCSTVKGLYFLSMRIMNIVTDFSAEKYTYVIADEKWICFMLPSQSSGLTFVSHILLHVLMVNGQYSPAKFY